MADDVVLCVKCPIDVETPATHFLEPKADYDPHCDACFAKDFAQCGNCGEFVPKDDIGWVEVCAQTRWEPAEYEDRCIKCGDSGPDEPDWDRIRDEQEGW